LLNHQLSQGDSPRAELRSADRPRGPAHSARNRRGSTYINNRGSVEIGASE
jgi:hypothetical protein